jgi:hypothetical protein
MTPEQEDAAVKRIGGALHSALMAEGARGTDPLLILACLGGAVGGFAHCVKTDTGADSDAINNILDQAITSGMRGAELAVRGKA